MKSITSTLTFAVLVVLGVWGLGLVGCEYYPEGDTSITKRDPKTIKPVCGNAACEAAAGETTANCPADCGREGVPVCGNAACEAAAGETTANCPADCVEKIPETPPYPPAPPLDPLPLGGTRAVGEACEGNDECLVDLFCLNNKCAAVPPAPTGGTKKVGEICTLAAECESEVCSNGVCGKTQDCPKPLLVKGVKCEGGEECCVSQHCGDDGLCKSAANDKCTKNEECASSLCLNGSCLSGIIKIPIDSPKTPGKTFRFLLPPPHDPSGITAVDLAEGWVSWFDVKEPSGDKANLIIHGSSKRMYPSASMLALRCPTTYSDSSALNTPGSSKAFESGVSVVVGADIAYLNSGAFTGTPYDGDMSYGDSILEDCTGDIMKAGSYTRNINQFRLLCGTISKDGIAVSAPTTTIETGWNTKGLVKACEYGVHGGIETDWRLHSNWGILPKGATKKLPLSIWPKSALNDSVSSGDPIKTAGKNNAVVGIRLKVEKLEDVYARAECGIEGGSGEPADDCAYWFDGDKGPRTTDDCCSENKDGCSSSIVADWNGTPTAPHLITAIEFITVPFNPKGDPKKFSGEEAMFGYDKMGPSGHPLPPDGTKGDWTKQFVCHDPENPDHNNTIMTGMVVRTNWFYGLTYIDHIECKKVAQRYEKK